MRVRLVRNKRGQFIIIAALLISVMIIAASTVMFSAVTYFQHERWEEYIITIDGIRAGTANVLQLSLANYTQTLDNTVLQANLNAWRQDVGRAYSGYGAILSNTPASGTYSEYGLTYVNGLNLTWNAKTSFSAANSTGSLNITSVGLEGYRFSSSVFLKMQIADALYYEEGQGQNQKKYVGVRVIMYAEGSELISNLQNSNFVLFQIGGVNQTYTFRRYYESMSHSGVPALNAYVYEMRYEVASKPSSVTAKVSVFDTRGIKVTGQATLTVINA